MGSGVRRYSPPAPVIAVIDGTCSAGLVAVTLTLASALTPTVQVALNSLGTGYVPDQAVIMAGALLGTLPLLIAFLLFGKQIVGGIMQGVIQSSDHAGGIAKGLVDGHILHALAIEPDLPPIAEAFQILLARHRTFGHSCLHLAHTFPSQAIEVLEAGSAI